MEKLLEDNRKLKASERNIDGRLEDLHEDYLLAKEEADKNDQFQEDGIMDISDDDIDDDDDDTIFLYSSDSEFESTYDLYSNENGDMNVSCSDSSCIYCNNFSFRLEVLKRLEERMLSDVNCTEIRRRMS